MALLRTRRWLGFTAVVLIAIVGFGLLSRWQWQRADQHRTERIALSAALANPPAPIASVPTPAPEWTPVLVTGRYRADEQVVVRKRPLNAMNGFWLMTPLALQDGSEIWVNRGWLPVGGDALATPALPAPPAGDVTVTGLLRPYEPGEAGRNDGLPAGQIAAPAAALLPPVANARPGFIQLSESSPGQTDLVVLPLPDIEIDEGRNISYAIQWILFALIAVGGWFYFLRREARESTPSAPAPAPVHEGEPWTSV